MWDMLALSKFDPPPLHLHDRMESCTCTVCVITWRARPKRWHLWCVYPATPSRDPSWLGGIEVITLLIQSPVQAGSNASLLKFFACLLLVQANFECAAASHIGTWDSKSDVPHHTQSLWESAFSSRHGDAGFSGPRMRRSESSDESHVTLHSRQISAPGKLESAEMMLVSLMLYARVLFFCEVNNNKNAKEYLCLGLLW